MNNSIKQSKGTKQEAPQQHLELSKMDNSQEKRVYKIVLTGGNNLVAMLF